MTRKSIPLLTKKRLASKEEKVAQHLVALKDSIDDYRQVVTRFLDKKFDLDSLHKRPSRAPTKSNLELSTIPFLQERSRQFYAMLQHVGNCPCHLLNLRLGLGNDFFDHRNEVALQAQAVFRLVAMVKGQDAGLKSLINIDAASSIPRKQLQALEVKPRQIVSPNGSATTRCDESLSSSKPTFDLNPRRLTKRVGFSLEEPKMTGKRLLTTDEGSHSVEEVEETPKVTEIDNLCVCLSQMGSEQSTQQTLPSPCLGYLSGTDDYRYLVYKISHLGPNMKDRSLQDLLQSESKEIRLSVRNRLQLAFTLSLSLLEHHSSPWITERLRSRDVVLIREENQKWSPYVRAAFNVISQDQPTDTKTKMANDQSSKLKSRVVFSLGVVLLEIGRSRLLLEPVCSHESGDAAERGQDIESELIERLEARRQVMKKSVAGELGPRYQDVVEKCILWEEDDDLSDPRVQKSFSEKVVCELDICLTKFDDQ